MDWTQPLDGYCERLAPGFWAEPLNALTNAAFLIAAVWMWPRCRDVASARLLCVILFAIGVGSFLFHTFATPWAALTDVVPIGVFILTYLFLVNRFVVAWPVWLSAVATALFVPYAWLVVLVMNQVPFFSISNFYWTVPILLLIYATALWQKERTVARGMIIGAGILSASITLRSVDELWCAVIPMGTHVWWHILNAVMLGWMIAVYCRHRMHA